MSNDNSPDYWDILEPGWYEEPCEDDSEIFWSWFQGLTEQQQALFPTHLLVAEVNNGGFHQYFTNSTGFHAPEAVLGFRSIGLDDFARLAEEAISVFEEPFPRERAKRIEFLDAFPGETMEEWNPFFHLDDRFYDLLKLEGAEEFSLEDRFTVAANRYVAGIIS